MLLTVSIILLTLLALRWITQWLQSRATLPGLHARHVLVTGCDTGFGRRLALRLDRLGCPVFAACLTAEAARDLDKETSERVRTIQMDVTNDEDIERAAKQVADIIPDGKGLWAIVNNAGIFGPSGAAEMMTRKDFLAALQVNMLGMTQVTRHFLPLVRKGQGRIVNMASVAGRFALSPTPYVVSKFAACGYTDVLRRELYNHGVKVICMQPGAYDTDLVGDDLTRRSLERTYRAASTYVQRVYGASYVDNVMKSMRLFKRLLIGKNPEEVVDAYVHALTSVRPSTSYVVGFNGKFLFGFLRLLPTEIADWLVSKNYPAPFQL